MFLKGQTAIVTGSSRGIGRAIALRYAREGANIVACARTETSSQRTASELASMGSSILPHVADVRNEEQVNTCVRRAIEVYVAVDILVNNAGISMPRSVINTDLSTWNQTLDTNMTGTYVFSRAVLPHMLRRRHGLILNVSSRSGLEGFPRYAPYCASKFAVMGFTFSLAKEVGQMGVRVNAICPGEVETDMNRASHPAVVETSDWLQPEEVTEVAAFSCFACGAGYSRGFN